MKFLRSFRLLALLLAIFSISCLAQQAPFSSTLQDLTAAKLSDYYKAPPAYVPNTQPTTDPAIFFGQPDYIKGLNKDITGTQQVNVPNIRAYNQYNFLARMWETGTRVNGVDQPKTLQLPPPPQYVRLDDALWDKVWLNYCQLVTACALQDKAAIARLGDCDHPGSGLNAAVVPLAQLPDPLILSNAPKAAPTGSPIGAADGAGIFFPGPGDSDSLYPDGASYNDGTGKYVKILRPGMFNTIRYWQKLQ